MALSQTVAFIGGGNMATALIHGLLEAGVAEPSRLLVSDVRPESLAQLNARYGVQTTRDNRKACACDVVVLAVKPQSFPSLLPELAPWIAASSLVISIAAGVPVHAVEHCLPHARVVRAMPNTPALVSAGATALAAGKLAGAGELALAETIFASVGRVVRVADAEMDAVTALSGSGPAYVFLLAEALANAGVALGLSRETASILATQTLYGAGKLLHESSEAPQALRSKVTSPGGTTAAGIAELEKQGFARAVEACLRAASQRGAELGHAAAAALNAVSEQ